MRIIYIYPQIDKINKEINLLRIVDEKEKETIVLYCTEEYEIYKMYIINTYTGETNSIFEDNNICKTTLDDIVQKFKNNESEITSIDTLLDIEKYILKMKI